MADSRWKCLLARFWRNIEGELGRVLIFLSLTWVLSVSLPSVVRAEYFPITAAALIIGVVFRALCAAYSPGSLRHFGTTWLVAYDALDRQQQFYVNILGLGVVLFYLFFVLVPWPFLLMCGTFFLYCACVVISDLSRFYSRVNSTLAGKAAVATGIAVTTALSYAISNWVVSEITRAPASAFPRTVSLVFLGFVPVLILILGVAVAAVQPMYLMFIRFFSVVHKNTPGLMRRLSLVRADGFSRRFFWPTMLFQWMLYAIVFGTSFTTLLSILGANSRSIDEAIGWSVYYFDMYPGADCGATDKARLAALGDDRFLVAIKVDGEIRFDPVKKCQSDIAKEN